MCSACSVVGFLAGNRGPSLGFCLTTENTETTEKEGARFRVFGVFCGWILGWQLGTVPGFCSPRNTRNTRKKKALVSVCSACSVVGFLACNWGQSLGFVHHGIHGTHGKRRLWFPCVRRVPWLNSRLVTPDRLWVFETLESAGR